LFTLYLKQVILFILHIFDCTPIVRVR